MKELMNHRYSLEEVLGTHGLAGEIADLDSFEDQIQLFTKVFSEKAGTSDNGSHRVASAVLHEIYENDGVIRVSELEQKLHYSRRLWYAVSRKPQDWTLKASALISASSLS